MRYTLRHSCVCRVCGEAFMAATPRRVVCDEEQCIVTRRREVERGRKQRKRERVRANDIPSPSGG